MKKDENSFYGQLIWGGMQEFERENPNAKPTAFRLWTELSEEEQKRLSFVGISLISYFRNTEGTEPLRVKLAAVEARFEEFRASVQKENKENGGR